MPFINLSKEKDDLGQVGSATAQIGNDTSVPVSVTPKQVSIAAPEPLATNSDLNPVHNGDLHEESKMVPTELPGHEINIDEEGVKEIKGPPLSESTSIVSIVNDTAPAPADVPPTVSDVLGPQTSASPAPIVQEVSINSAPTEVTVSNLPDVETVSPPAPAIDPITGMPVAEKPLEAKKTEEVQLLETPVVEPNILEMPTDTPVNNETKTEAHTGMENELDLGKQLNVEPTTPAPGEIISAAPEESLINPINPKSSAIESYFDLVLDKNASDLHFTVGYPPFLRMDGSLQPIGSETLEEADAERILFAILNEDQKKSLVETKEIDFSFEYKENARFRINMYYERGHLAAAFRYIPTQIKSVEELKLPKIVHEFIDIPHGLILVTGPTGSGKSTTIASMIQEINLKQRKHIITVEDPIEYVYPKAMALVDQREVQEDTHSWDNALRATLRQDPNVVVVGEMRDYETIAAAITVAETGHLVFSTLHTNTAVQTIDRIIDVFPEHQQAQIRSQLANVLTAVISQRLVPVRSGGRRVVTEILIGTNAVRNAIREAKTYQIDNIIQTSFDVGMSTLERSLVGLIREGELSVEEAQKYTTKPDELLRLIKKV